jgi:hypothetical protein
MGEQRRPTLLDDSQFEELLLQSLEHERGDVQILEGVLTKFAIDPEEPSPCVALAETQDHADWKTSSLASPPRTTCRAM